MRQCIVSIRCLQNTPYSWHPPFFEPRSSSFRFRSQSWTLPRCLDGPYRTSSQIITVRWMVLSNSYDYDFQLFTISCEQLWYLLRWSLLRWSSGCLERHLLLVSRCSEFFYGFFSGGVGGLNILDSKIHQSPQWYQLLHLRYGLLWLIGIYRTLGMSPRLS